MTRLPSAEYLNHPDTWRYFLHSASGSALVLGLPGVFGSNPYPHTVNGSLWTIRYEMLMYLLLSIIGLTGGLRRRWVAPFGVLLMVWWWIASRSAGGGMPVPGWLSDWFNASDVSSLGVLFLLGSSCAAYRLRPHLWMLLAAVCGLWLATSSATVWGVQIGVWILVAAATMWGAHAGAPRWTAFPRDDLSYGIYIYAFPIQQAVTEICLQRGWGLGACVAISLALTCAMAAFSWHCIEKPCIRRGRRLIGRFSWRRSAAVGSMVP
jgi:peptidoglycan/LPS O-acetylase OafA/YrhL